jgi:outer membrane PBP1 activator LpoA protein
LLQQRQLLPAASILSDIDSSKLSLDERAQVLSMHIELLYLQGQAPAALTRLEEELPRLQPLHPAREWQLQQWQLRLLLGSTGGLAAARHADGLLDLSTEDDLREGLVTLIWHQLQASGESALVEELRNTRSARWSGWLELALLAAQVMDSPAVQVEELEIWRRRHPDHPVSGKLPGGLELLAPLGESPPARIALLLPLSGGMEAEGRAIVEGFLAAQFEARGRGWPEQQLLVMDSNRHADIGAAYSSAVAAGADLVIGPLAPEDLSGWEAIETMPAPIMTLDWLPQSPEYGEPPYQLALAPEDEARQLARLAFDAGARDALVVRPRGDWGDTMADALLDRWNTLEGSVHAIATYSGQSDYSSSLKEALNLAQSEARANTLRQLMGTSLEFSPRRRKDIDTVFLLSSNPQDARSIKPLIAFHYAGDLPVYSTSHIFSGRPDPQRDRDLNGIRLVEIPWVLGRASSLPDKVAAAGSNSTLAARYAQGADAFILHWRLGQLREDPRNRIRGYTGLLNMDVDGRLHRELVPARMRGGLPEAM